MNESQQDQESDPYFFYVGTYTNGSSDGIYVGRLDMSTGELGPVGVAAEVANPSYLAVDVERNRLYAVNEVSDFAGRPGGAVSAFAIQPSSGALSLINQQHSHGGAPCYLSVDQAGRHLLVANYGGGNVAVLPISSDGMLGPPTALVTHSGSSLHPQRQTGPHPHSIVFDLAEAYAFVPDLGLDRIMQYRFERQNGRLLANQRPWVEVTPGGGPRHLVFHPDETRAYAINELNSTITAYAYDSNRGLLEALQMISTLPEEYSGPNLAADLHLTPDGRFLFGSNRGHDSIACYEVDQGTGRLNNVAFIQTQGRTPRGFAIDPSGRYLLAANQDSHNIVIFRIDRDKAKLVPTGHVARIPSPVCIKFAA